MTRIFAAADIGSNTAHLLVAETDGSLVMRIDNYNEWIPLGETVAKEGIVPKEQIVQIAAAIKEFKRVCKDTQVLSLYVFATEGLRMARNHEQVIKRVANETGIKVEIISARKEAELSLAGVLLDTRNIRPELLFEVGGGSAQIGVVEKRAFSHEESLPLGTGRIIAESGIKFPCSDLALRAAETYIDDTLKRSTIEGSYKVAVVSGGVARGLWRALHPDAEKELARAEIEYMAWAACRLSVDRIMTRFGVKSKRAGTLLPGALIYRALMERFGLDRVVVSEFGIREGAILKLASGEITGCPV
ncbi:MAG TPA: hypothetical protein VG944_14275 [Fimbriimonas sp.]|nr:hypothetical protein [Fimbriimonas sp.]